MNKLLNRLRDAEFTLLVSLPRNDVRLAQAAIRGGAQGLKVHINVDHHASGTHFGTFDEERENLARIVEAAGDAPVGIVPGGAPFATPAEFEELAKIGVDFFDAYPGDAPTWTLSQSYLGRMLAAFETASGDTMKALERMGMEMCEASIINQSQYGQPLSTLDLARYSELSQHIAVPFIVPSQKNIVPGDVPALRAAGAKGVLIGAVVTGKEPEGIENATRAFSTIIR
jgi:hypothetical protein